MYCPNNANRAHGDGENNANTADQWHGNNRFSHKLTYFPKL